MTILDIVEEYKGKLKIGTKDGGSYFYIGTGEDVWCNYTNINRDIRRLCENKLNKSKDDLLAELKLGGSPERYAGMEMEPTVQGYVDWLDQWFHKIKTIRKRIDRRTEDVQNHVPFSDRAVLEYRDALDASDPDCKIVIIEGNEPGAFWTTDEAKPGTVRFGCGGR